MNTIIKNALFTKDENGVIILTDINEDSSILRGEVVYDGKNAVILNRNGRQYFVLKNIPPFIRKELLKAKEVTIVENKGNQDVYSYSVKVRLVDDLNIQDEWVEYSNEVLSALQKNMTPQEFSDFLESAEKIYKTITN